MSEITLQNQLNELNGQVTSLVAENEKLEKKVDRILELLEGQDLSTSAILDGKKIANNIEKMSAYDRIRN